MTPEKFAPRDKTHYRASIVSTPMDSSRIQVLKPSGGTGTLDLADERTVKQVLREVADGGWVVLKGSTKATAGCAKEDIVDNKVSLPPNRRKQADRSSSLSKRS